LLLFFRELDLSERLERHCVKGFLWPFLKPIDGTAVHQGREEADTVAQALADGRHAEDKVEVIADTLHKEPKDIFTGVRDGALPSNRGKVRDELIVFVAFIKVRDLPGVQNIINIFKEDVRKRAVGKKHNKGLPTDTGNREEPLQVVVEIIYGIRLPAFQLFQVVIANVSGELCERPLPHAADANEKGVAAALAQHAANAANVRHAIRKQDQGELALPFVVVAILEAFQSAHDLCHVFHFLVIPFPAAHKVAKEDGGVSVVEILIVVDHDVKVFGDEVRNEVSEQPPVVGVRQAVVENAQALVCP
jgi:hypothetical protein